jgi:sigma-B regulation protein RsbU (phosphoserine phosphatase)
LIRHSGNTEEAFTEGSFPVGLVPEAEYATAAVKLEPGDTLVLFSDGVTEAMDPQEEFFGVPRLAKFLAGHHETPLDELQKLLLEAVENFAQGASQADDLTLLLVRYRAAVAGAETDFPRTITSASAG